MANITISTKVYTVYATISQIANGEITSESVKFEFPVRNSRAAQKAIAENKHVKAKDVNVLKIETVNKTVSFNGDFDALIEACEGAGFEKITE